MSEGFASIASYLPRMAARQPHALAIVHPDGRDAQGVARYTHYTYAQLDAQSDLIARGLQALGVGPGVRTVLMLRPAWSSSRSPLACSRRERFRSWSTPASASRA